MSLELGGLGPQAPNSSALFYKLIMNLTSSGGRWPLSLLFALGVLCVCLEVVGPIDVLVLIFEELILPLS